MKRKVSFCYISIIMSMHLLFWLATTNVKYNYEIVQTTKIPWGGKTLDDFLETENDEEMYGPVIFTTMRKKR